MWDLPLRVFHWAVAIGFTVSFISVKTNNMEVHIISAMCVLGLLIFRVLWGLVGSFNARFLTFFPGPIKLTRYLRGKYGEPAGHSPLGALSVFALLVLLILQLMTGLVADDDIYITGPLRDMVDSKFASWATGRHVFLSDILLGFVILHIVAILFYWIVKKNNLVKPMITGYKMLASGGTDVKYAAYNKLVAVAVIVISALAAYGIFNWV